MQLCKGVVISDEGIPDKLILNISVLFPDLPAHSVPGAGLASPRLRKPLYICFLSVLLISR